MSIPKLIFNRAFLGSRLKLIEIFGIFNRLIGSKLINENATLVSNLALRYHLDRVGFINGYRENKTTSTGTHLQDQRQRETKQSTIRSRKSVVAVPAKISVLKKEQFERVPVRNH